MASDIKYLLSTAVIRVRVKKIQMAEDIKHLLA